jgi:hypothetical protein
MMVQTVAKIGECLGVDVALRSALRVRTGESRAALRKLTCDAVETTVSKYQVASFLFDFGISFHINSAQPRNI